MDASHDNGFGSFTKSEANDDNSKELTINHSATSSNVDANLQTSQPTQAPQASQISQTSPTIQAPQTFQSTQPVQNLQPAQPIQKSQPAQNSQPLQPIQEPQSTQFFQESQPAPSPQPIPSLQPTEPVQSTNQTMLDELNSMQEDIVLANNPPDKNKRKLLIIAICAAIVLIALVITGIIIAVNQNNTAALKTNWHNYYSLLLYGPNQSSDANCGDSATNCEINTTNWYPEIMSNNNSAKEYDDYYNSLKSAYETFLNSAKTTKTNLGDYETYSKVFFEFNTTQSIQSTILDFYLNSGSEAATAFINSLGSSLDSLSQINSEMQQYFSTKLQLMEKYNSYGCYKDSQSIDSESVLSCQSNIANTHDDVASLISTNSYHYWNMVYYYNHGFSAEYLRQTKALNSEIGG